MGIDARSTTGALPAELKLAPTYTSNEFETHIVYQTELRAKPENFAKELFDTTPATKVQTAKRPDPLPTYFSSGILFAGEWRGSSAPTVNTRVGFVHKRTLCVFCVHIFWYLPLHSYTRLC